MSEQNCIHKEVCRFWPNDPASTICSLREICKFFRGRLEHVLLKVEEPVKPRRKKKRKYKYKKRKKASKKLTTSKEDIARVRGLLRTRRNRDILTEDEMKALDVYAGKFYKDLSETAKQQILDIEKESKNRMVNLAKMEEVE